MSVYCFCNAIPDSHRAPHSLALTLVRSLSIALLMLVCLMTGMQKQNKNKSNGRKNKTTLYSVLCTVPSVRISSYESSYHCFSSWLLSFFFLSSNVYVCQSERKRERTLVKSALYRCHHRRLSDWNVCI